MSDNKKIKFRLNVFDIIIIVLAIAAAAVILITKTGILKTETASKVTNEVTYTVELAELPQSTADMIKVGDSITDKIKKVEVGEVTNVEIKPYKRATNDFINGNVIQAEVPDRYKAVVTIKANATETDTEILVNDSYQIRVGMQVSMIGPGYVGTGYLTTIERGNNK